jgi:hypothetical protein
MANINTFPERFRLGRPSASPFQSLQSDTGNRPGCPSLKLEYCPTCKDEVDTETHAHHEGTTYAYKRWCLRCGHVLARGIYHNVPILSDVPLPAGTAEWTLAPGGPDRR